MSYADWTTSVRQETRDHSALLWIWFWITTIATAFAMGFVYKGFTDFNFLAFLGGFAAAAIGAIPVMLVIDLLITIVVTLKTRPSPEGEQRPVWATSPPAPIPETATRDHADPNPTVPHETPHVGPHEPLAGPASLTVMLSDPDVAKQARELRRIYGKDVCASFLTRKASEMGLGDVNITGDDIPETF